MGKLKFILLSCFILIATSCDGLFGVDNNVGKPIQFGTQAYPTTRTVYTNETDSEVRLEWVDGDKVSIYMEWDGSDYNGNPESANYSVTPVHNNGRYSYGKITPIGESLKWHGYFDGGRAHEYKHTFYSAYPASEFANNMFEFYLPSEQDEIGMDKAYMAAYSNSGNRVSEDGGLVYLEYYPMITTLCITIYNDLDYPIPGKLSLISSKTLAGDYFVKPNGDRFMFEQCGTEQYSTVTRDAGTIGAGEIGETLMFFIIPQKYINDEYNNELSIDFNGDIKPLPATILPYCKYNIKITTKEIEVEEPEPVLPPVDPGGLSNGACQFLMGTIESLQEVFRALLGNDFINNRYNGLRNLGRNITAEDFYQYLTEEDIIGILTYFQTCSEVELKTGNHLDSPITADDFLRIIPSCQTLTIRAEQETEYWFKDLKLLQTIKIEGNGKVIIHADGCSSLTSVTWWNSHTQNGSGIYINGEWHKAQ